MFFLEKPKELLCNLSCSCNKHLGINNYVNHDMITNGRKMTFSKFLGLAFFIMFSTIQARSETSTLWGKNGEKWKTTIIPDFTNAGYKNGKTAVPVYTVSVNVKEIGAKGDGVTDDTKYFRDAIKRCGSKGAVFIPNGTYVISDTLQIKKGGIALRGQHVDSCCILFKKGIEELYPHFNGKYTKWSYSGAMILFSGNITDMGIENLTIKFPDNAWDGHNFHEKGYNGIGFTGCSNGWIRNVTITGADLGIWIEKSASHISIDRLLMNFGPVRGAAKLHGHHGINCYGSYNIFSNFEITGLFIHDLSVESSGAHHNVFMQGKGTDICFDHHAQNYNQKYNLFTEIDIGKGSRMYQSGGVLSPKLCFNETWWNIKSVQYVKWVTSKGACRNNVQVGINTLEKSALPDQYENYFENIPPQSIEPKNLYWAQMKLLHNILPPDSKDVVSIVSNKPLHISNRGFSDRENYMINLLGRRLYTINNADESHVLSVPYASQLKIITRNKNKTILIENQIK